MSRHAILHKDKMISIPACGCFFFSKGTSRVVKITRAQRCCFWPDNVSRFSRSSVGSFIDKDSNLGITNQSSLAALESLQQPHPAVSINRICAEPLPFTAESYLHCTAPRRRNRSFWRVFRFARTEAMVSFDTPTNNTRFFAKTSTGALAAGRLRGKGGRHADLRRGITSPRPKTSGPPSHQW